VAFRVVYFGLPLGALVLAADGHDLVLTVLSPVAGLGRRRLLRRCSSPVVEARELEGPRGHALVEELERARPDLLVSWFWTRRLSNEWLHLAKHAAFGVHPSLLPRHRGPDPYYWAIDAGDRETGVTAHLLEEAYDTGAMLGSERLSIGERNAWQLARALDRPSLRLLREIAARYRAGDPPVPVPQAEAEATLAPEPDAEGLRVRWDWPNARILRRIRALAPVPGLALELHGVRFRVTAARPAEHYATALEPGEAQLVMTQGVTLRTGDGAVVVERATMGHDDERSVGAIELVRLVSDQAAVIRPKLV
jgi:methionyl-tRNA formyltransferase